MTAPAIKAASRRMEEWAKWLRRQEQHSGVKCNLLGKLLGESMEGYRRGGIRNLSKAFACLIPGSAKPELQEDDQGCWEVQAALDQMPRYMKEIKRVLCVEYLFGLTQETKCADKRFFPPDGIKLTTYKSQLNQGLMWMDGRLQK